MLSPNYTTPEELRYAPVCADGDTHWWYCVIVHSPPQIVLQQVKTPRFLESSDSQVTVVTLHIVCDTEGATIHYTLDGGAPSEKSATPDNSGRVVVTKIGTHTIRAIGVKEGMQNSDEAKKEFTVEASVGYFFNVVESAATQAYQEGVTTSVQHKSPAIFGETRCTLPLEQADVYIAVLI